MRDIVKQLLLYFVIYAGKRKKTGKNTPSESGATPKPGTPQTQSAVPPVTEQEETGTEVENGETKAEDDEDMSPEQPKTV